MLNPECHPADSLAASTKGYKPHNFGVAFDVLTRTSAYINRRCPSSLLLG